MIIKHRLYNFISKFKPGVKFKYYNGLYVYNVTSYPVISKRNTVTVDCYKNKHMIIAYLNNYYTEKDKLPQNRIEFFYVN